MNFVATTSSKVYTDYTSISEIKSYWNGSIAPHYFNFSDINNYNAGIFGYVNEVMANTTEDAFNAVAISRREFYPVTAQFESSLYAMAALQNISIPLTTPARCRCILLIPQQEILTYSTENNGVLECVLDDRMKIFAGELPFMVDYPIVILSKRSGVDRNGQPTWSHTIHYDISMQNSLNTTNYTQYISNKVLHEGGTSYVALFLECIRQVSMYEDTSTVIKDSIMDTITMDIDFDGNLANFEVFYKEDSNSEEMQLKKILINAATPATPYVQYQMLNRNKLRLTFAYNTVFTPKFNSEIITRIYTSEGANGNFNKFTEDVVCSCESDRYPYNDQLTIVGRINGSAVGGEDAPSVSEFRTQIVHAYAMNQTITTSNDLQLYFDEVSAEIHGVKVLFKKKRDDPLIRLFGAYSVMKDENNNVVPTNTLEIECSKSDLVPDPKTPYKRLIIPPGTVWGYKDPNSFIISPIHKTDGTLMRITDVSQEDEELHFVNPYLIALNVDPNNVGYYMNSIDKNMSIAYTYINDDSAVQFIGSNLYLYRNAVVGTNYYKFQIMITPAADVDRKYLIVENDPDEEENQIIAKYNGKVIKEELYRPSDEDKPYVRFTILYDTEDEEEKIGYIRGSNTLPINGKSITGYKMRFGVGESFVAGDILATKRPDDLGNLLIIGDLTADNAKTIDGTTFISALRNNGYYTAFSIQDYTTSGNGYIMEMYISTEDEIDITSKIVLTHGVFSMNGKEQGHIAVPMNNQLLEMNVLFNNPGNNRVHKYSGFTGLNMYTLTNTYVSTEDDPYDFVGTLPFIRSTVEYYPSWVLMPNYLYTEDSKIFCTKDKEPIIVKDPEIDDYLALDLGDNFTIVITESPVIGAMWATNKANFDYFIKESRRIHDALTLAYYKLENNFSMDNKFYNTYGKARFFTIGNHIEDMVPLNSVRCRMHFGVRLSIISSTEQFITKFRQFIKGYVEADDRISIDGQDLYMMNLIHELELNFDEIEHLEYYGINIYDHGAQKILGPDLTDYQENFIPEFLNLDTDTDANGRTYPAIVVEIMK